MFQSWSNAQIPSLCQNFRPVSYDVDGALGQRSAGFPETLFFWFIPLLPYCPDTGDPPGFTLFLVIVAEFAFF